MIVFMTDIGSKSSSDVCIYILTLYLPDNVIFYTCHNIVVSA